KKQIMEGNQETADGQNDLLPNVPSVFQESGEAPVNEPEIAPILTESSEPSENNNSSDTL
ncbi:MAG: hypothetical protein IKP69_01045, partial [Oscillospiraceae bacterium]|nr:hypothetical protein [Oscillospiraceae bacterium]